MSQKYAILVFKAFMGVRHIIRHNQVNGEAPMRGLMGVTGIPDNQKSDSVEMTDSMMDDHHRFSVVIYDAVAPCQELPIPAVHPKQ